MLFLCSVDASFKHIYEHWTENNGQAHWNISYFEVKPFNKLFFEEVVEIDPAQRCTAFALLFHEAPLVGQTNINTCRVSEQNKQNINICRNNIVSIFDAKLLKIENIV